MENNWKEIVQAKIEDRYVFEKQTLPELILELMNLVFEATKKECTTVVDNCYDSKGRVVQNKEYISNINKPNL